jgi:hypothetical protein
VRAWPALRLPAVGVHELDPTSGQITYPEVLRDPRFDPLRKDVDDFFAKRAEKGGSVDFYDLQHWRTILHLMHGELQRSVEQYDAGEYGHAVNFVESLEAATHGPT